MCHKGTLLEIAFYTQKKPGCTKFENMELALAKMNMIK